MSISITIKADHYSAYIGGHFVKLSGDDVALLQSIGYSFHVTCQC